ncbi:unnamed protein product [Camellia sinensis]
MLNLSSEDLRPNGVEAPSETIMSWEIQTDSHLEEQQPHDFHADSSQDILPESTTMGLSNVIPVAISADDEVNGKESGEEVNVELSANIKTSSESVDDFSVYKVNQTTNFIGEKSAMEISDLA